MKDVCYIVQVQQDDGPIQVGPFAYKYEARSWLLDNTGSAHGGLVMLVLKPWEGR